MALLFFRSRATRYCANSFPTLTISRSFFSVFQYCPASRFKKVFAVSDFIKKTSILGNQKDSHVVFQCEITTQMPCLAAPINTFFAINDLEHSLSKPGIECAAICEQSKRFIAKCETQLVKLPREISCKWASGAKPFLRIIGAIPP